MRYGSFDQNRTMHKIVLRMQRRRRSTVAQRKGAQFTAGTATAKKPRY